MTLTSHHDINIALHHYYGRTQPSQYPHSRPIIGNWNGNTEYMLLFYNNTPMWRSALQGNAYLQEVYFSANLQRPLEGPLCS
ncbi:hypothetical protein BDZ91DRAFT_747474 [Kalaharituber pfeilii]|nr:hypothetical protein BDZ91DRAFT_747474 [Kalaharituber pfeilii]